MKKEQAHGPLKVIAGRPDRPLRIGDIEIPCYVLEDETRVLSQRGIFQALGIARGGTGLLKSVKILGDEITKTPVHNWLTPFISKKLALALKSPILSRLAGRPTGYMYPSKILNDLCNAILEAHKQGATTERQKTLVHQVITLTQGVFSGGTYCPD